MPVTDARKLLADRAAQLDKMTWGGGHLDHYSANEKLSHVVRVMSSYTNTEPPSVVDGLTIDPAEADAVVATCAILDDLSRSVSDVVSGPLARSRQQWIGAGRRLMAGALLSQALSERNFTGVQASTHPVVKPHDFGLYTSTIFDLRGLASMWKLYLDQFQGSTLFPPPWNLWQLEVDEKARIFEIAGAQDWVALVESHPMVRNGVVYPDWSRVAGALDGVHFTFRGVVATQSLQIQSRYGPVVAPFWDVEQTFWLHWRFSATSWSHRKGDHVSGTTDA
jgi:hypothetical protein